MNAPHFSRRKRSKLLFVWDGTNRYIEKVQAFARYRLNCTAVAVTVLPHESIYSYGTVLRESEESSILERKLKQKFNRFVEHSVAFRNVKLELLFGDLVEEISVFANLLKATHVLIPKFKQSKFSAWIHGDLGRKLVANLNCQVVFLDSDESETNAPVRSIMQHYWS